MPFWFKKLTMFLKNIVTTNFFYNKSTFVMSDDICIDTCASYDIITCFDIVVQNIDSFLAQLNKRCNYLILYTGTVSETEENIKNIKHHTAEYIEEHLAKNHFSFIRIDDALFDTDWQCNNTGRFDANNRRLWICANNAKGLVLEDCLQMCDVGDIPVEIKQYCSDTITPLSLLDSKMQCKTPRISIFVSTIWRWYVENKLKQNGYNIYGVYDSKPGICNVMAVLNDVCDDVSFVIQGIPKDNVTDMCRNFVFKLGIPIDVTWKSEELSGLKEIITRKRFDNKQNVYYQSRGTLNGLMKCTTPFVIKVRSDEWYSDLNTVVKSLRTEPDKIITNNVFARKISKYAFHMSDHVIGGTKENMMKMFSMSVQTLEAGRFDARCCAEQHFAHCYLRAQGITNIPTNYDEIKSMSLKYFKIISIKQMGDFMVVANSMYNYSLTNNNMSTYYSKFIDIESIEEM